MPVNKRDVSSLSKSGSAKLKGDVTLSEGTGVTITQSGQDLSIAAAAGSGDVSKVGTPADNQVGVWTGDGTIEGTSGLTYDGTTLATTGALSVGGDIDVNGNDVAAVNTIDFDSISAPAHNEGTLFYDSTAKALSYYNEEADVTVNVGQEVVVRVRNTTGSTITNGSVVYVNGSAGASLPTVALAQADALSTSRVLGMATHDIENNSNGYITTLGEVNDLDTSGFSAGDTLFLSPSVAGGVTATRPTGDTEYAVVIGYVTISNVSIGSIKVTPGETAQLANLITPSSTDTLTNKTLTSPKINENVALTATATELNILDGATLTTAELNHVDGVTSAIQTQLDGKVNDTGNETIAGVKTFSSDPIIPDEAYDATAWNGSLEPPTKNAIRDKIESLGGGGDVTGPASSTDNAIPTFDGTGGKTLQDQAVWKVNADGANSLSYTGDMGLVRDNANGTYTSVLSSSGSASLTVFPTLNVNTIGERTASSGVTIDGVILKDTTVDVNGTADAIILDADADTTISSPTDDQIDFEIAGADDFRMTANTFTALSGSTIATNTIAETTAASGVTIDGVLIKDTGITVATIDADNGTSVLVNDSLAVNNISERTVASGVTVDGLLIKDSKLATNNSVVTSNITNAAVTADKLGTGASAAYVATSQTTTSTSYTDLATTGPAVTVTIGANGLALVSLFMASSSNTATANQHMGFAISGASTQAAADEWSCQVRQVDANALGFERQSAVFLVTGLSAGSTTFTAKYRVNAGTGTFMERRIAVVPL